MKIIEVKNLSKRYINFGERRFLLKELLLFWKRKEPSEFWALKDITFAVNRGQTLGIIGENAAGKSTILRILSGVTFASSGWIKAGGRISSVLELGVGFHPELTGRENLNLSASLIGYRRRYIKEKFEQIVKFAELEKFVDVQIKKYSSGMLLRLAFSLAINVNPDILLIDEVLAVGDESFQRKCINKIKELKTQGKTIIFASHDLSLVLSLCDRAILLREGRIIQDNKPKNVVAFYLQTVGEKKGIGLLQRYPLAVIFNHGKVRVFFKDEELTKDIGLHSCLYANSRWYNSTQAEWTVKNPSPDELLAEGNFKELSLAQTWRFTIQNENELSFDVRTSASTKVGKSAFNLLLNNLYTDYLTPDAKGSFPEISSSDKSWWEILQAPETPEALVIKDAKELLPSLGFELRDKSTYFRLLNTDYQVSARAVQLMNPQNLFSARLLLDIKDIDEYMKIKLTLLKNR